MPHVVACTPLSHEMVLSVATSAWLHNFPELSLLPLVLFHCLLRAAEARGATCKLWMDPCQHVTNKFTNIDQPNVCRMAGHAAQARACGMCWNWSDSPFNEVLNSYHSFDTNQTDVLQRNCRPSPVLPHSSRPVPLQNKTTKSAATSPYSHFVAKGRLEEFTPFCTAASSSNGALPTPSGFSQQYSLPLSDLGRKAKGIQTTHTIRAQSH